MIINVSDREFHTILASLQHYQETVVDRYHPNEDDIATNGNRVEALDVDEIDTLCERINTGAPQVFFIRNKFNHNQWWNNETGWGSCEGADIFDNGEHLNLNLPVDGSWCPAEGVQLEVDRLNQVIEMMKHELWEWEESEGSS